MRVVKKGEVRKEELIINSVELFYKDGYKNVSIQKIIDKTEVTKGAFYYYFKSKEDLLNSIIDKDCKNLIKGVEDIYNHKIKDGVEKINKLLIFLQNITIDNTQFPLFKTLNKDSNIDWRERFIKKILIEVTPFLTKIIEQGIEEKIFNTPYPEKTAETFINISFLYYKEIYPPLIKLDSDPKNLDKIRKVSKYYQHLYEKILGTFEGRITLHKTVWSLIYQKYGVSI